ncbi:patatin-like phospholipase family protein [Arthrobacter psychrolactophilus]
MKRSLVLAGGGMRVAWQAGVVKALAEEGLHFDHLDGTSGGILTTAMMLSGVTPDEMIKRWRAVNVRNFSSALPLRDYLKGPWNLPALSDADGIVNKVFPALGIDVERIRTSTLEGSFNVANFTEKRSVALDATEIDADLLAAGMSLPLFMTPLRRDGETCSRCRLDPRRQCHRGVAARSRRGVADLVRRKLPLLGRWPAGAVRAHDRDERERRAAGRLRPRRGQRA